MSTATSTPPTPAASEPPRPSNDRSLSTSPSPARPSTGLLIGAVTFAFLAVSLDGFDAASMGASVPVIAQAWGIEPSAFTGALTLTNVGLVIGYFIAGRLGAAIGRKNLLLLSTLICGIFQGLSATAIYFESMELLTVFRLCAGIGLGMVLPAGVAVITDMVGDRMAQISSILITIGIPLGQVIGGMFGYRLLGSFGSDALFIIGAGLTVPVLLGCIVFVREPAAQPDHRQRAAISELFRHGNATVTVLLWAFAFFAAITLYTMIAWAPTLLLGFGFSPERAPLGIALVSTGGIIGGLLLIPLAKRIGNPFSLAIYAIASLISSVVLVTATDMPEAPLMMLFIGMGLGSGGVAIGQVAVAVGAYHAATRTTGVAMASAAGRVGSIVGPTITGAMLAANMSTNSIIAALVIPLMILVAGSVLILHGAEKRRDARREASAL